MRVAFIARGTDASCPVVVDLTDGVNPAFIVVNTGIFALLADTCKCSGTVAVYGAFRLALHIGISLEARRAGADASVSRGSSNGILAAGVGVAGLCYVRRGRRRPVALHQGVTNIARQAGTQWRVVPHFTLSVPPAGPNAGIVAVIVSTCLS